jgi:secreted trypsin-like serine protease
MIKPILTLMLISTTLHAIDGGKPVKKGDFPAVVKFNNSHNDGKIYCTGSLIAPNILITAAHCVEKSFYKQLRVSRAGDHLGEIGSLFKKNFKVKNVFYLDEYKTVNSEIRMIGDYIRGTGFRSSSYTHQHEIRENLKTLEEKKINSDIAFIELTKIKRLARISYLNFHAKVFQRVRIS